jgi:NADPH:quinone reductase-like Zn-dependent oxidoreductase
MACPRTAHAAAGKKTTPDCARKRFMKAIVYYNYGSPDVLQLKEIERPTAANSDVLIKVRAASVNPLDCGELKGVPFIFRMLFGLRKPATARPWRPGVDVAGIVEAVGSKVTRFQSGDGVFGICISDPQASGPKVWVHHQGAFAEYVCAPESMLATKPDNRASSVRTGGRVYRAAGSSRQRTASIWAEGPD